MSGRGSDPHWFVITTLVLVGGRIGIPEFGHGHVRNPEIAHRVPRDHFSDRALHVGDGSIFVRQFGEMPEVVVDIEVVHGGPHVPQEALGMPVIVNHVAQKSGHEGPQFVSAASLELLEHRLAPHRPGGHPHLPAIQQKAMESSRADRAIGAG
ncbi:hypothetical protein OAE72_03140 [Akkermansiaceae bacterium]|nr:hypothetical protein [Akkermansiaceae bacterium]